MRFFNAAAAVLLIVLLLVVAVRLNLESMATTEAGPEAQKDLWPIYEKVRLHLEMTNQPDSEAFGQGLAEELLNVPEGRPFLELLDLGSPLFAVNPDNNEVAYFRAAGKGWYKLWVEARPNSNSSVSSRNPFHPALTPISVNYQDNELVIKLQASADPEQANFLKLKDLLPGQKYLARVPRLPSGTPSFAGFWSAGDNSMLKPIGP